MKKILILGLMLSFLMPAVLAVDQGINASIGENITVVIAPSTVEFGAVLPGTNDNHPSENITFNATGSNVNITIETNVTGDSLFSGMEISASSWVSIIGATIEIPCIIDNNICTYDFKEIDARLDVPIGTPAGAKTGTITYTITGTTP